MKPIIGFSIVTIVDPNRPDMEAGQVFGTLVESTRLTGYGLQTIRLSDGSLYRSEGYLKSL